MCPVCSIILTITVAWAVLLLASTTLLITATVGVPSQHKATNSDSLGTPKTAVALTQWNAHGINLANEAGKPVVMSEFSSVACGGYPTVSDTFGATLWSTDYAMQMAVVGYSAAYLHTRERNVSYNLFNYPGNGVNGWTTGSVYYSYFPILQGLQSYNGSRVVDLGLNTTSAAGYGIYDKNTSELYRMILINFQDSGNGPVGFVIPKSSPRAGGGKNTTVKFLTATSLHEVSDISWSGQTWNGVQDGKPVSLGRDADLIRVDMSASYTLQIPSPGLAVVMFEKPLPNGEPSGGGNGSGSSSGSTSTNGGGKKNNGPALLAVVPIVVTMGTILVGALALN